MTKIALFLTPLWAAGFVIIWTTTLDRSTDQRFAWKDEGISEQEIETYWTSYKCFKETLEATVNSLRRREISLPAAQAQVGAAARRYHPVFLDSIESAEDGATEEARLARNLVSHVHALESLDPSYPSPVLALDAELQEFLSAQQNRTH